VVLRQSGIDFHSFGDEGGEKRGSHGEAVGQSKGLVSCQLDSLTPFGVEQTNRGISWADSVDLS